MTINELQKNIDNWIQHTGNGYFDIKTNMCLLMEEVGELSKVIARTHGEQIPKEGDNMNYKEEIADILWVLICISNQLDVDLTKELHYNIVKKSKRDVNRYKK